MAHAVAPRHLSASFAELQASFSKECERIHALMEQHAQALRVLSGDEPLQILSVTESVPGPPGFEVPAQIVQPSTLRSAGATGCSSIAGSGRNSADSLLDDVEDVFKLARHYVPGTIQEEANPPSHHGSLASAAGSQVTIKLPPSPRLRCPGQRITPRITVHTMDAPEIPTSGSRPGSSPGLQVKSTASDDEVSGLPGSQELSPKYGQRFTVSPRGSNRARRRKPNHSMKSHETLATPKRAHQSHLSRLTSRTAESRRSVFVDQLALTEHAKEIVWKGDFDVGDLYNDEGWAQHIARHHYFHAAQLALVFLNSVWIGLETDLNQEEVLFEANAGIQIVEQLFCFMFFTEFVIRVLAFDHKLDILQDVWTCFDGALLLTMVFETWVLYVVSAAAGSSASSGPVAPGFLRIVRLSRLTRSVRIARLLRSIPELTVIIKGILVVTRTVFLICCLLLLVTYVFAIILTQLSKEAELGNEDGFYRDVPSAMLSLVLGGLIPDMAPMTYHIAKENVFFASVFLMFVLLGFITILNMLVGVLVQVVAVVAAVEAETNQLHEVKKILMESLEVLRPDITEDDEIHQQDIVALLSNTKTVNRLIGVGIDTEDLQRYSSVVFKHRPSIKLLDFWNLAVQLRGNNTARVKDLVHMRQFLYSELYNLIKSLADATVPKGYASRVTSSPHVGMLG